MKLVTAIIKPFDLDNVLTALVGLGIPNLSVTKTRDYGMQRGAAGASVDRGLPALKLELAIDEKRLDAVVDVINATAGAGRIGDGNILVAELQQVISIHTREMGLDAVA